VRNGLAQLIVPLLRQRRDVDVKLYSRRERVEVRSDLKIEVVDLTRTVPSVPGTRPVGSWRSTG
jgi:hypothetical protein